MNATNRAATNTKSDAYWIEQLEALERLEGGIDFQKVIMEILTEQALDGVKSLTTVLDSDGGREAIVEELVGISWLQKKLDTIKKFGEIARQNESEFNED